jgi:hypothetical protein
MQRTHKKWPLRCKMDFMVTLPGSRYKVPYTQYVFHFGNIVLRFNKNNKWE